MRCIACDRTNASDARFCIGCGTPLAYGTSASTISGGFSPTPATAAWPGAAPAGYAATTPFTPTTAYPPTTPFNPTTAYPAAPPSSNGYPAYGYAAAAPGYPPSMQPGYPPSVQVVNNIHMPSVAAPSPVIMLRQDDGPNLLVRALWFLFIGLWLGALSTVLAWLLNLTIIGLPLGLMILNRLPRIMTLKPTPLRLHVSVQNGVTIIQQTRPVQRPLAVRALYFLLIGCWGSALWLLAAWLLVGATLGLGLPLAFWMFDRVPFVTTLSR
jgi:hypothetical protein